MEGMVVSCSVLEFFNPRGTRWTICFELLKNLKDKKANTSKFECWWKLEPTWRYSLSNAGNKKLPFLHWWADLDVAVASLKSSPCI